MFVRKSDAATERRREETARHGATEPRSREATKGRRRATGLSRQQAQPRGSPSGLFYFEIAIRATGRRDSSGLANGLPPRMQTRLFNPSHGWIIEEFLPTRPAFLIIDLTYRDRTAMTTGQVRSLPDGAQFLAEADRTGCQFRCAHLTNSLRLAEMIT